MNDSLTYIEALKVIKNTEYSSKKSIFIASSANQKTISILLRQMLQNLMI